MNFLERYLSGECEQVWSDLQELGASVRQEPNYSQALEVSSETMRRVRNNCERLIGTLQTMGYAFGVYPDGTKAEFSSGPLVPLSGFSRQAITSLEQAAGPLPLSLVSFWEQVGSVSLVGLLRAWPSGMDPLVIHPPEAVHSALREARQGINAPVEVELAPDALHKANLEGGTPYAVQLPDPGVDFLFRNEKHNLYFVSYLRLAILHFGGFPGLEGGDQEFDALPALLDGLEAF